MGEFAVHMGVGSIVVSANQADFMPFSANQADFMRYGFAHELPKRGHLHILDHASDDVALTTDCASDRRLARPRAAGSAAAPILVPVLGLSADESFVNLN